MEGCKRRRCLQEALQYTNINEFLTFKDDNNFRTVTKGTRQQGCLPSATVYRDLVENRNYYIFADKDDDVTDDGCLEQDDVMYLCNLRTIYDFPPTIQQEEELIPSQQYQRLKTWLHNHPHAPRPTPPIEEGNDNIDPPPTFNLDVTATGRNGRVATNVGISTDKDNFLLELLELRAPIFNVPFVTINIGSRHIILPDDWSLISHINTPNEIRVVLTGARTALPDQIHQVHTLSVRDRTGNMNIGYGSSHLNVINLPYLIPNIEVLEVSNVNVELHRYSVAWWTRLSQAMNDKEDTVRMVFQIHDNDINEIKNRVRASCIAVFHIADELFQERHWDAHYRTHMPEDIEINLLNGFTVDIGFHTNIIRQTFFHFNVDNDG